MKRILIFLICGILLFVSPLSVAAQEPKIIDNAGLLTAAEIADLELRAKTLTDQYMLDVVILTVDSLDGKHAESYADDYYDQNGYGIGSDYSGILLLLSMEYRDWAISTCGEAIYTFSDYSIQDIFSQIAEYLSDDQYYFAFIAYLDAIEVYMHAYQDGTPIDDFTDDYYGPGSYEPGMQEEVIYYPTNRDISWYAKKIGIALLVGAIIAGIVLLVMRSKMNTAKAQHGAISYMLRNTYRVELQQDIFLYSQLRKVRKSENNTSGGHRGGGSSVHHSSSGRSHGGGHGKF